MRYPKQSQVVKSHKYIGADFSAREDQYLKKKFQRIIAQQKAEQEAKAAEEQTRKTFKQIAKDLQDKQDEQREVVRHELRRIA